MSVMKVLVIESKEAVFIGPWPCGRIYPPQIAAFEVVCNDMISANGSLTRYTMTIVRL